MNPTRPAGFVGVVNNRTKRAHLQVIRDIGAYFGEQLARHHLNKFYEDGERFANRLAEAQEL